MFLMIDNYDSFTYNIVQYLGELGTRVVVHRNDEITVEEIEHSAPEAIVISPGPCTPDEAGISMEVVRHFRGKIPIMGICLGFQSIGQVYGAAIVRARKVMHGKLSVIHHNGNGLFAGLPPKFEATRYHSLVVDKKTIPNSLEITAWTQHDDGSFDEVMGLRHQEHKVEGVQFHPESLMTRNGHDLLRNFLGS